MSELPVDDGPDLSAAAHEAARGHVVYLTEHGERLAAIVPAEFAALLEGMTPDQARELVEDLADGRAARQALTFRPAALRALRKLDRQIAERIKIATEALRDDPRPSGAKMLTGSHGLWRIRIGDYRVVAAGHRRDIYTR